MKREVGPSDFGDLLLKNTPLIDVRAPVEFNAGHLPNAVNLPLLTDEERAAVGLEYKTHGQDSAIKLGQRLVQGVLKEERVARWCARLEEQPDTVIYCFRGGLRSQISREWIQNAGIERPLITGGFKAVRGYLIERLQTLSELNRYFVVSGPTGSGKTELLAQVAPEKAVLNLEQLANHRGSAFGAYLSPQPSQVTFENHLALEYLKILARSRVEPILIEDESRMIGRVALPTELFEKIRTEPLIMVDEKLEARVENIYQEYVVHAGEDLARTLERYAKAVTAISKKLGGANTKEILELIARADHHAWIKKLLTDYYDPLYTANLQRRGGKFAFVGSRQESLEFIRSGLPTSI